MVPMGKENFFDSSSARISIPPVEAPRRTIGAAAAPQITAPSSTPVSCDKGLLQSKGMRTRAVMAMAAEKYREAIMVYRVNLKCSFHTASSSRGMFSSRMVSQEGKPVTYSSSIPTPVRPPLIRPLGLYSPLMAAHCMVTMTRMIPKVQSSFFQFQFLFFREAFSCPQRVICFFSIPAGYQNRLRIATPPGPISSRAVQSSVKADGICSLSCVFS